ncbi:hypothetical protein RA281_28745, partial [Pseudomonas syringae pv. tagetis]
PMFILTEPLIGYRLLADHYMKKAVTRPWHGTFIGQDRQSRTLSQFTLEVKPTMKAFICLTLLVLVIAGCAGKTGYRDSCAP